MLAIKNKFLSSFVVGATVAALALFGLIVGVQKASAAQSPAGCTADNSVVNISSNTGTAVAGDVITFSVDAGNPVSANGCDITGRTLTLTLPDTSVVVFGPFNYPNPTAVAFVGSAPYVANNAHAVGGFWTANVSWNGTLNGASDLPSNGSKNASVKYDVKSLEVSKTANTSFDQKWNWTIDKTVDDSSLLLSEGQTLDANYTITVNPTSVIENAIVSGSITITNPVGNPTATIETVNDELSIGGTATVTCPETLPKSLTAGSSFVCTYTKNLGANNTDQTNTATVTTSGFVPGGSSNVATVDFTTPVNVTDECVTVSDTNTTDGPQGVVICQTDSDKSIEYAVTFGPQGGNGVDVAVACGEIDHPNTASFVTNDTQATGHDDQNVHVNVNCLQGCTLTQGYWKTHNASFKGGAPIDANWINIGASKELTGFFTTIAPTYSATGPNIAPFTWFSVFNTPPKGNVYYNLAHQYEAAKLNILNGASAPASVASAITAAENIFKVSGPSTAWSKAQKASMTTLAGTLGSFNEGTIGPGHCDETPV